MVAFATYGAIAFVAVSFGISFLPEDVSVGLPSTPVTQARATLFAQHGTVESVALPTDRETGRPRGFGFVEMPQADAQRAMQALNGFSMGGRPLRVNEAQDRPRTGGGGGRPGGGGGRPGGGYGGGGGGQRRW